MPQPAPPMYQDLIAAPSYSLQSHTLPVPMLFAEAGLDVAQRFIEFFTAEHRNPNTRAAYAQAVRRFTAWTSRHGLVLSQLTPVHIAAYIEELGGRLAPPSVKQHLAAIRMLFDYLVRGGSCRHNPATAVRGPKHVVTQGKTPVLTVEEAKQLFVSVL